MTSSACPQCRHPQKTSDQGFCTQCGLALKQPCPHCSAPLRTPEAAFTNCPSCQRDFWSCRSCGRLYHLDRTSCQNSYCPDKDVFWTTRFGENRFLQTPQEANLADLDIPDRTPSPAWLGGATAATDIRWPGLHSEGLILSSQESGVVELWAERGAPHASGSHDFQESSVCLTRLDLGEGSPCPPFSWQNQIFIPGSTSLSPFELSSSPSLGRRLPLDEIGKPRHFGATPQGLLVWGDRGLGLLSSDGFLEVLDSEFTSTADSILIGGDASTFLYTGSTSRRAKLVLHDGTVQELCTEALPEALEYGIFAGHFILLGGHRLVTLSSQEFRVSKLPALVVAGPIYNGEEQRLTLLMSDGSARTCSPQGDRFSFLCELAGAPSTPPLRLGEYIFYGTEGRYLCRNEEALRPRLSSAPIGALSYANSRLFGTCRDGSMFSFELK